MELTELTLEKKELPDLYVDTAFISLPLKNIKPVHQYILKNVEGLSYSDQSIVIGDSYGTQTAVQNITANPKDIVLRVGLRPIYSAGQTVATLRDHLYSFMSPSKDRPIKLTAMHADDLTFIESRYVDGYITKIEADTFSNSTDVFVTIKCAIPFFRKDRRIIPGLSTIQPGGKIEFFANGTAFNTFTFTFRPNQATVNNLTISSDANYEKLKLSKGSALYSGNSWDHIHVNTDIAEPEIARFIDRWDALYGKENLINYLTFDSNFMVLPYGRNKISVNLPAAYSVYDFTLTEYYWGI